MVLPRSSTSNLEGNASDVTVVHSCFTPTACRKQKGWDCHHFEKLVTLIGFTAHIKRIKNGE